MLRRESLDAVYVATPCEAPSISQWIHEGS